MLAPLLLLTGALTHTRTYIVDAPSSTANCWTIWRARCWSCATSCPGPAGPAARGAAEIQHIIAGYLAAKAGTLAMAGVPGWPACSRLCGPAHRRSGRRAPRTAPHQPLVQALHQRVTLLGEAFRQIVAAQFWIAPSTPC
jgi:hypothetical protein